MNSKRFFESIILCANGVVFFAVISPAQALIRPPKTLTDPNATSETQSLMSFLVDYYGQQVLSGQWDLSEISYIQSITGKQPAMGCFDFMEYSPSRIEHGSNPTGLSESYMNWANTGGGIVSLCWHWNAPTDLIDEPNKEWWRGFYTDSTTFDIQAALADPNGNDYQLVIRDLDAIAVQIQKFQDANLPILWRPLHEASGGWFWWGAKGPGPFIQLWRLMYDRYVNYHGLHNLIWVYTVGDPAWYPGDDYVDIVGMDIYPSDSNASMVGFWNDTQSIFQGKKLVTLSESGIFPDPNKIRADKVWWSWFAVWGGTFTHQEDPNYVRAVYNDADVITLDELIDWKHYPVIGGAPIVSITQPAQGAGFAFGSNVTITADACDPGGAVTKVEFYKDDVKLGEDTTAPYSYTWASAPTGQYVLRATATDNNGLRSDSQEINITVGAPLPHKIIRYEAENAIKDINGPNFVAGPAGYSGTGSMYFNGSGGTGINFSVNCNKAGSYPLTIRYQITAGWGTKTNDIYVNGSLINSVVFANTNSAWATYNFGNINLNAGTNTVRIQHNWGYFYVDYIEIEFTRLGDFKDYADFSKTWNTTCNSSNNWCSGFDFVQDGTVAIDDLKTFTESWLTGI
jgi:hypothetical protein